MISDKSCYFEWWIKKKLMYQMILKFEMTIMINNHCLQYLFYQIWHDDWSDTIMELIIIFQMKITAILLTFDYKYFVTQIVIEHLKDKDKLVLSIRRMRTIWYLGITRNEIISHIFFFNRCHETTITSGHSW